MIKNVYVPSHVRGGIRRLKKGHPIHMNILGADVETRPYMLLGFERENIDVTSQNICEHFLRCCDQYSNKKECNIVYFHNLRFDLQVILKDTCSESFFDNQFYVYFNKDYHRISYDRYETDGGILLDVRFGKSVSAVLTFSKGRVLYIYDTFQYFRTSLHDVSVKLKLAHQKIDEYDETSDYASFKRYSKNDVWVVKDLGKRIDDFQRKYDVPISISVAGNSSKILRHYYFRDDTWIPFVPNYMLRDIELSYHGGKNGYYFEGVELIKDVFEVDITSAYPDRIVNHLPNFNKCDYRMVKDYQPEYKGVYRFTGDIKKSKYQVFYCHNFNTLETYKKNKFDYDFRIEDRGSYYHVRNLRVTSPEMQIALKYNLVSIDEIKGFIVIENKDETYDPLKAFMIDMFSQKDACQKDDPEREFYKVSANSIYGKTIENIEHDMVNTWIEGEDGHLEYEQKRFKAGIMYNPMIATLITGGVRAYITDLEFKYGSLHTSTDSIKTTTDPKFIKEIGHGLGKLEVKSSGDCLFFRNKCYIHFDDKIVCRAHGFHGKQTITDGQVINSHKPVSERIAENLIKMYINRETEYEYERMGNIRESLKRKDKQIKVCDMNRLKTKFNVRYKDGV